jgi:hypothetical protein
VAKERQTMLMLRRGLAGEPPSLALAVGEIAPRVASTLQLLSDLLTVQKYYVATIPNR